MARPFDDCSGPLELRPQVVVVVYLTVEHEDELAIVRQHRLVTRVGELNDSQASKSERNACSFIKPRSCIVGSSAANRFSHRLDVGTEVRAHFLSRRIDDASEPAHGLKGAEVTIPRYASQSSHSMMYAR